MWRVWSIQRNIQMWLSWSKQGITQNVTVWSIQGNIRMWRSWPLLSGHTNVTVWLIQKNIQMWRCDPYKGTYKCDGSDPYKGTYKCDGVIQTREHTNVTVVIHTTETYKWDVMSDTREHTNLTSWSLLMDIQMWRCDPYKGTYKCDGVIHRWKHANVTLLSIQREHTNVTIVSDTSGTDKCDGVDASYKGTYKWDVVIDMSEHTNVMSMRSIQGNIQMCRV